VVAGEDKELDRRRFLRKAALTGLAAWSAPVLSTVSATPAFGQSLGSPSPPGGEDNEDEDGNVEVGGAEGGGGQLGGGGPAVSPGRVTGRARPARPVRGQPFFTG
jgi:hypothetical protein